MIQVNRIYLIFNRLVTKKFLVDTSVLMYIVAKSKKEQKLYLFLIYVGIYLLFCCCWLQKVFSRGYYQERISLW